MIVVRLLGGLGNQLFQYACGRALALRHNEKLFLDIEHYYKNKLRTFRLDQFNIQAHIAAPMDIYRFGVFAWEYPLREKLYAWEKRYIPWLAQNWLRQPGFEYVQEIHTAGPDVYLDGFWQSPMYFKDVDHFIKREATIKYPPLPDSETMLKAIETTESVGVHVRRGDYVTHSETNRAHGTCSIEYYRKSYERIKELVHNPVFFIFSDDIHWVQENLTFFQPAQFVYNEAAPNEIEDFRLLTACRHFIIANSTFSWWAAWLSENKNKQVIIPDRWFANSSSDTSSLYPQDWIRL